MADSIRFFINNGIQDTQVLEFFRHELKRAGFGGVKIIKTPMGNRVIVYTVRVGSVIGRQGRNIKRLTHILQERFGLENPQIDVKVVRNPTLNAEVMASRLISQIERGFHFRRAAYSLTRKIMAAGARGVEIYISGTLTSQRARTEIFREGFVAKCGDPAFKFVDESVQQVTLKRGVLGVKIRIMKPETTLPDEVTFKTPKDLKPIQEAAETKALEVATEEEEKEEVIESEATQAPSTELIESLPSAEEATTAQEELPKEEKTTDTTESVDEMIKKIEDMSEEE